MFDKKDTFDRPLEVRFSGVIENGFCWDDLARERMRNKKALEPYGYKVYSQNDEDGIIHEIFKRIGTTNKTFIEFGVQDGLESNCHLLLYYGWRGLWLEGSREYYEEIALKFRPVIENGQLKVVNAFITKDNINHLFHEAGFTGEIDLLSIDIDGNDLYVWENIEAVNPRVVITEYNGKFPPDLDWKQAYHADHVWDGTDWHGASLKAFEILGRKKGYQLVGTDLRGCNAFFVRNDLAGDLFFKPATAEALYNPLRTELQFVARHPAKYCLAVQKDHLGILNYQSYELAEGFWEEETADGVKHAWTSSVTSTFRILATAGAVLAEIPYALPAEVISHKGNCEVSVCVEGRKPQTEIIDTSTLTGKWEVPIPQEILRMQEHQEDSALTIQLRTSYVWKPCEVMESSDERSLGVDILLSEINLRNE